MANKDYKCGHRSSPGPGGMNCPCCNDHDKTDMKRRLNREVRRKQKQKTKKESKNEE